MKKSIVLLVVLPLLGFGLYWNHFVYLKKLMMMQSIVHAQNRSVSSFTAGEEKLLSFHPELDTEETIVQLSPPVLDYLSEPRDPDAGHKMVAILEEHKVDRPRALIQLGAAYLSLWADYGNDADRAKSQAYFERTLELRPNDPSSLYCLYTVYSLHGDQGAADRMAATIQKNWNDTPKKGDCPISTAY